MIHKSAHMWSITKINVIIPIFLAVGMAVSYFLLNASGVHGSAPDPNGRLTHDEQITQFYSDPVEVFNVGFRVQKSDQAGSAPYYVVADILIDDDFMITNGANWRDRVSEMVRGTNDLLGQVGIEIRIGSIDPWVSESDAGSLQVLVESAESQSQRDPSRLLIVITCQDPPKVDGLAQSGYGRVIVEYYHNDVTRNAALLSHEIGHLFGASHHEDAIECVGDGCVMDEKGFQHYEDWCNHHRELIGENTRAALAVSNITDRALQRDTEGEIQ